MNEENKVIEFPAQETGSENLEENPIDAAIHALAEVDPGLFGEGGVESIAALISLPEEQFHAIRPIIEMELEKSLNNVGDKLILTQALNANGSKAEDLVEAFELIAEQIDTQMEGQMSKQKRDFLKHLMANICNAISDTEGIAKKIVRIPIELCHPDAKIPTYANATDAGMDVYALEDITIHPGETVLVKTGLKVAIPVGYEIQVRPKSGRALKTKMRVANSPGTIDSGYRDEIGVIIDNIEPPIKDITYEMDMNDGVPDIRITSILHGSDMFITKGEKFAQLVLSEKPKAAFYEVDSVSKIENDGRNGGFGSTGLK
jgi:dUTP pyrophosphatase